jgi:hypothetical protein
MIFRNVGGRDVAFGNFVSFCIEINDLSHFYHIRDNNKGDNSVRLYRGFRGSPSQPGFRTGTIDNNLYCSIFVVYYYLHIATCHQRLASLLVCHFLVSKHARFARSQCREDKIFWNERMLLISYFRYFHSYRSLLK